LAVISLLYDAIFIFQHYVLYRNNHKDSCCNGYDDLNPEEPVTDFPPKDPPATTSEDNFEDDEHQRLLEENRRKHSLNADVTSELYD